MTTLAAAGWRAVVPIKGAGLAKSRLVPPPGVPRDRLAHAMARDTLETLSRCIPPGRLVVVTSDPWAVEAAGALGTPVEPDPGDGLNAAVLAGARRLADDLGPGRTAVLLADLPALQLPELAAALEAAARHRRAFVPDRQGTGTVLLTAATGVPLRPRFGAGSAGRHARGAARLDLELPSLRGDVDDRADLEAVLTLGVGPRTAAVLSAAGPVSAAG